MALPAVLAEQVLPRLLVVAFSATYCRWTVYGPDVPHLLPFARKVSATVLDGTGKSPIRSSLPQHLNSCPLALLSLGHRAMHQAVPIDGTVLSVSWFDIHGLRRGSVCAQTRRTGKVAIEPRPTGSGNRAVRVVPVLLAHTTHRVGRELSRHIWNARMRPPLPG
jgi:hypothetical protein